MHYFLLVVDFAILLLALAVVIGTMAVLLDISLYGHDLGTTRKALKQVGAILRSFKKDGGVLYDLGSCRGNFVVGVVGECPGLKATGVDRSRHRIIFSKILARLFFRKAHFIQDNFFTHNVSDADVVYMYLDQSDMPRLESKLQKELKLGAIAITNTQHLPNWQPTQTFITHPNKPNFEKMFVYIKS